MKVKVIICLVWLAGLSVPAQSQTETNGEPRTAVPVNVLRGAATGHVLALAQEANDPTAPLTLIQFRDVLAPQFPGYNSPGNVFQIQPVFPIFPSRLLPFEQLVKMTVPLVTTPNPGGQTGLGDLQLFDLVSIKQSWGRWGFGPAFAFPTATGSLLGQGKWQAGPALGAIYTGINNLTIGAVAQNPFSFAGDPSRPATSALTITPTLTYNLPHGWFGGFSDFNWTFDWKNGGVATIPVGLQAGKIFFLGKMPASFSIEGAYVAARPHGAPDWIIGIELTFIFPTLRKL